MHDPSRSARGHGTGPGWTGKGHPAGGRRHDREAVVGLAQRTLKSVAAGFDRLTPGRPGVVVLIYHRVGATSGLAVDLPDDLFAAQMERLAASGRVATLAAALDLLAAGSDAAAGTGEPGGPDPVVVTFDDGTADFADRALPILARHGIPATLYVATDFVETGREFPDAGVPLSWSALRDCVASGLVTVGSHTHTHALLDRLAPERVAAELDRSIELIGERLDVRAEHFAYPKALMPSASADAAVRARFRSAAIAGTRPNPYRGTDPYLLARSPVQVLDGLRYFDRKADGGMGLEDRVRELVNRRRYAEATS